MEKRWNPEGGEQRGTGRDAANQWENRVLYLNLPVQPGAGTGADCGRTGRNLEQGQADMEGPSCCLSPHGLVPCNHVDPEPLEREMSPADLRGAARAFHP